MFKSVTWSVLVGAIVAIVGWTMAVLLLTSMSDATFDSLRFGWAGLMAGSISITAIFVLLLVKHAVEPVFTVVVAAAGAALLWGRQELPFVNDQGFQQNTPAYYWSTITFMVVVLALLLAGLRAAQVSTQRTR